MGHKNKTDYYAKYVRGDCMPRISQQQAEDMFDEYSQRGDYDFIVHLVEEGYDPSSSNAYYYAAESGYLSIVEFLDEVSRYRHPNDALFAAKSNGYYDIVDHISKIYRIKY